MPRIGTREANFMPIADRQTRISLLWLPAFVPLWLAGCGAYGGGSNGGGGGRSAPAAPTGVTATAANAQVNLTWNASAGATGYYVKRSTSSGTEIQIAAPSATAYSDNSVSNGTTYYYVVSSYNSYGQSANSAEVNATPAVPPAPAGLTANVVDSQVALTWPSSSGATSYNVKRSTTNGNGFAPILNTTGTNFTDSGLTNGTTYYYVVSAVSSAGEGPNSNQASAT